LEEEEEDLTFYQSPACPALQYAMRWADPKLRICCYAGETDQKRRASKGRSADS